MFPCRSNSFASCVCFCSCPAVARALVLLCVVASALQPDVHPCGFGSAGAGLSGATPLQPLRSGTRALLAAAESTLAGKLSGTEGGRLCVEPANNTILEGQVLKKIPNSSLKGCCQACNEADSQEVGTSERCNAFMYCDGPAGCIGYPGTKGNSSHASRTCLLMYQVGLDATGATLKTTDSQEVGAPWENLWFAGAPARKDLQNIKIDNYYVFAYGMVDDGILVPEECKEGNAQDCWVKGDLEDAKTNCDNLHDQCQGIMLVGNDTARLLGDKSYARFLLQLTINYQVTPSKAILVKHNVTPNKRTFLDEGHFLPTANFSEAVDSKSGCVIEPNTNYAGRVIRGLVTASAAECCKRCEDDPDCNAWTYCPNPTDCDHPRGWFKFPYQQCNLKNQAMMESGNGTLPFRHEQGLAVPLTSGLPGKVWYELEEKMQGKISWPNDEWE